MSETLRAKIEEQLSGVLEQFLETHGMSMDADDFVHSVEEAAATLLDSSSGVVANALAAAEERERALREALEAAPCWCTSGSVVACERCAALEPKQG